MTRRLVLMGIIGILGSGLGAQSINVGDFDLDKLNKQIAVEQEIAVNFDLGLVGGIVGAFAGSLFGQTSSTVIGPSSSVWTQTGPTSGAWITIPGTSTTTTQISVLNTAVGAAAGAAISIGVYELGHRVLKWW